MISSDKTTPSENQTLGPVFMICVLYKKQIKNVNCLVHLNDVKRKFNPFNSRIYKMDILGDVTELG